MDNINSQTKKIFLYARKSTDEPERQVLSIEAQMFELREFAKKERLNVVREFVESKTAKEPGREIFNEMIASIEKNEAEGILAWHPDRLARNSIDGGRIIYLVDTGKITTLKFPTFWFDPTPQGKFMLNIAFGQSKYYVDNLSENIRRGIRQKLRNGIWPAWAPLGYVNDKNQRKIVVDKEKAKYIKRAFEMYATGEYPLAQIRKIINSLGLVGKKGKMLSVSNYQYMLKNKIYYGMIEYNGEMYDGKHEPIITKKLFDSVQQVMNNRGKKKRKRKHEFAFSGLMKCGNCDCLITAEKQKGHHYYRCTKKKQPCNEKYLREENLVEQMKAIIQKVSLPDNWAENMLAEIDKEREQAKEETKVFVQNLQAKKTEIEVKAENLLDLFISGKGIEPEEYQQKKQKLLNEKLNIQQKIKDFEQKGNNWLEPMKEMILASSQAKILLSQSDNQEIRAFLKNIGSKFILKDKKFQFALKIGWRALAEGKPTKTFPNWRRERDSNPRSSCELTRFPSVRTRPLCDLSNMADYILKIYFLQ